MLNKHLYLILVITLAGCSGISNLNNPLSHSSYSDIMTLQESSSARISTSDLTGQNYDAVNLESGKTLEIANLDGAGCIRHIYFTVGPVPHYLTDMVLRMYWDGEEEPSVEVPFGDLFGMRYERVRHFQSEMVSVNPGYAMLFGTHGFNFYFPMPFSDGARITLTNDGEQEIGPIWYHFDYETMDNIPDNLGRFHAQWRRENPTQAVSESQSDTVNPKVNMTGDENYVILEAEGHGNLAGYFLHIDNIQGGWYGEGDDMIFIDGEGWPPSINGTGSEEIFGGGACPANEYTGQYAGLLYAGNWDWYWNMKDSWSGKNSMYRYYILDPIRFQKSIRVTIEHGHANDNSNDYSSTVFWYQTEPHASFPTLPAAVERYPVDGNSPNDIAWSRFQELVTKYIEVLNMPELHDSEEFTAVVECLDRAHDAFTERNHQVTITECEKAMAIIDKLKNKNQ